MNFIEDRTNILTFIALPNIPQKIFPTSNPCLSELSTRYAHFDEKRNINKSAEMRHGHEFCNCGKEFAVALSR
jgi:hypothetical protein